MADANDAPPPRRRWFNFGRQMTRARWLIVVVGILLPYAARIPGMIAHGPSWFTSYVAGWQLMAFIASFNVACWVAVLVSTFFYRHVQSVWFPVLLGFGSLAYQHATLDLAADAQAAIGLIFIPFFSLPYVAAGALIGLAFDRLVFKDTAAEAAQSEGRFSLRTLFLIMTLVAIGIGLLAGFQRYRRGIMRESIRQSVLDGQLDAEKARPTLGDEVDTLRVEAEKRRKSSEPVPTAVLTAGR